ncbi:uncharacterized protein LOC129356713 [Poeciliopsis prolifica]|uniref:uncharacterized protein LOC129356713 n=1 Tax=Poeciliopsis prolifica TaxID=188132 RepID=UPI002414390D|nr:uncharacterized protein LOC129356713 [Poeciliopsis prolifica]
MCSVQPLRAFIRDRLAAAAEEIFSEVERTVGRFQEELDAQRRLLALCLKPQVRLTRIEHLQHHVCKEEVLMGYESTCSLDRAEPEPLCIKEEQMEPNHIQIRPDPEEPEPAQLTETLPEPGANAGEAAEEPEPFLNLDGQEVLSEPDRPQIIDDLGELEYLDFDEYLDDPESPQITDDLEEPELLEPEHGLEEPEPQNRTRKVEFWTRHDDEGLLLRKEFDTFVPRQRKSKTEEPVPGSDNRAEIQQNYMYGEEVLAEQEQNFSLDLKVPDRPQIKQEQEDVGPVRPDRERTPTSSW